jgi:predicted dehydrogenase
MLNTAIVGLGWWGKTLVKSAREFGAPLRFVSGITLEPETVRDFAAEHQIALGTSLDEVLDDKSIQAVILATPHTKHRAQVEAIAAAGKHIYCEKPFALSKADAQAALDACKRAGIVIAVGHHFRLMPSMRVLADLKEKGAFGTIMHAEGNYSHDWLANYPADSWRLRTEESRSGGMTGMGIHVLDCFRDMVGPMKRISALSKARVLKLATGDTTSALVEFENGATGTLATTMKTPFAWRIAIFGENCWAASVSARLSATPARIPRHSTCRPTITSAAISITSQRRCWGRANSRFRPTAFCRRQPRSKRSSNRSMPMAPG